MAMFKNILSQLEAHKTRHGKILKLKKAMTIKVLNNLGNSIIARKSELFEPHHEKEKARNIIIRIAGADTAVE